MKYFQSLPKSEKEINFENALPVLNYQLQINYNQNGIQSVSLLPSSNRGLRWLYVAHQKPNPTLEMLVNDWFQNYQDRQSSTVSLPFDWTSIPLFTQQVLKIVATIPFGQHMTYGQIAHLLGHPQAARAVGKACGRNPFILFIPCHRVVGAKRQLRGYSAGGIAVKKDLLLFEQVNF